MRRVISSCAALLLSAGVVAAQQPPASQPVSREEYERVLQEQAQMRQELNELKAERNRGAQPTTNPAVATPPGSPPVTQEDLDDLDKEIRKIGQQVHSALPGSEHLVIAGDGAFGFTNQRGSPSTFFAGVAPLILWQPTNFMLVEAAADIGISTDSSGSSSTSFDLKIANASFIITDWLVVGGGLFVVPFGQYHNHFDPSWIDKLPTDPIAFGDGGLAPSSQVGIFARGAFPIATTKLVYDVYVANGPQLIVNDPNAAGSFNFDDFTDLNNGKAVGGRIGFLPIPSIETGYSFQYAQTSPSGFQHVYAFLQAFDLNIRQDFHGIGVFTVRTEWIWSSAQRATYGGGSTGFGPITFSNYRTGGYAELAYRPTYMANRYLRNVEVVTRFNYLRTPLAAPGGDRETLWEFGVDYWITPSAVLKVAYGVDNKDVGQNQNAFNLQLGIGF